MGEAGSRLIEAEKEALGIARGEVEPGRVVHRERRAADMQRQRSEKKRKELAAAVEAERQRINAIRDEVESANLWEHESDVAQYSFSCKRWGDFLTIKVTRLVGTKPYFFATTINLGLVTSIRLLEGRAPNSEGHVKASISYRKKDDPDTKKGGSGISSAPDGYEMVADAWNLMATPGARGVYEEEDDGERWPESWNVTVDGVPGPAKDDRVYLAGLGAYILAPFGEGPKVLDAILKEIAEGFSAKSS